MARKLVYLIDGRRWLPLGRAATLAATSPATIKRWMGDGSLDWTQSSPGSRTLVVEEAGVLRLRAARGVAEKEVRARTKAATRTADDRMVSMRTAAPPEHGRPGGGFGVFDRTWDPLPMVAPVSGRERENDAD